MPTMNGLKKTFRIGKVTGYAATRRDLDIELELSDDGRLSISGAVWNLPHSDIIAGGQMEEDIRAAIARRDTVYEPGWNGARLGRLLDIWERWHLNDMKAGCVHQRAGVAAYDGDPDEGTPWDRRPIDPDKPTNSYGTHFPEQRSASWNMLGWIRPDEHPHGLLTRPCPVCGYGYGTAWTREELPEDVREIVARLVAEGPTAL